MLLKIGVESIELRRRILTTYARPQDYALDPQSDEGKEWPECEMNAEEGEGLLNDNITIIWFSICDKECKYVWVAKV